MPGGERLGIQIFHHGVHKRFGTHLPVADNPHVCNCCGVHLWPARAERESGRKERASSRWRGRAVCNRDFTSVPGTIPSGLDVIPNSSNSLLTKQLPKQLPQKNLSRPEKSDTIGEKHLKNHRSETFIFLSFSSLSSTFIFLRHKHFSSDIIVCPKKHWKKIFFLEPIISTFNK